ncbi:MAG: beta-lactamase family protein [Geminicoccaceae bacterium]|nr:beta-lactamase family protein [Geminicoccaceae bacterium]
MNQSKTDLRLRLDRRRLLARTGSALAGLALGSGIAAPAIGRAAAKASHRYFPNPDARGGWRTLVAPNVEPSSGMKREIRRLAGVDWSALAEAFTYSESFGQRSTFLVIRRGWIAAEFGPATAFHVDSVSKSVTGLAVARLLELSGDMRLGRKLTPKTPVSELLPASFAAGDPRRRKIRLGHLMSMTSGLEPDDDPYRPDYGPERVLHRPVVAEPGAQWAYCSATVDLLALALQNVTGRSLSDFFDEQVGARIGMAPTSWGRYDGLERACCGAVMTARDLARLGWLLLAGGRWGTAGRTERILSPKIVQLLTRPSPLARRARFTPTPNSPFRVEPTAPLAYGMLWWTNATGTMLGPSVPTDAFYAHGFRESLLIVVPSLELVVVRGGSLPLVLPAFRRELMARVVAAVVA